MGYCEVKISQERRPCLVQLRKRGGQVLERKALFYGAYPTSDVIPPSLMKGGHQGGIVQDVVALVEYEDGSLTTTGVYNIKFLDSAGEFAGYDWTAKE